MQRREMDRRQNPRHEAERDAQPLGGPPRADDEDDELDKPEEAPSFLTAQELQAREPAKDPHDGEKPVGERRVLKERRRNPG
ncbi:MAG TPA: hypothetical protein VFK48_04460 [Usitatibacter sp.]|nr:hypothetical protein [Usitatibacter sp.]